MMVVHHPSNREQFDSFLVDAGDKLVVIDFFATWCGPCRMMTPKFEEFSKEFPNAIFVKIDIDEQEAIAQEYHVQVMPTFVFIKDGNRLNRIEGNVPDQVRAAIRAHLK